ncbi:MAG: hypothetical protein L3J26_03790 [Candidatus Polarisedimenticolaceae bacterium]|nr:hypothetical protein [Candidatus Polarisedimenticolaceae bacterium]
MKLLPLVLLGLLPLTAQADPAAFVGVSYSFGGGGVGITVKVLSDDEEDQAIAALGATYYPIATNKFGIDLSAGYAFDGAAVLVGWDFLQKGVQVSAGWADTENDKSSYSSAPAPSGGGGEET